MNRTTPVTMATTPAPRDVLLLFLPKDSPEAWLDTMARNHPNVEVRWGNPRDYRAPEDLPAEMWDGVTVYCSFRPPPARLMKTVRFVQLTSAGADLWVNHPIYQKPEVEFCTSNGIHPPQIAEWVIGTYLAHSHQLFKYADAMKTCSSDMVPATPVVDSTTCRMGILGYGTIGRQCARYAQVMGMEVYAYTRNERPTPASRKDDGYTFAGLGDTEGTIPTRWFHGASKEAINDFLSQDLDILVMCLPLTVETRGLLGAEQFAILSKKKTFVSNVSRGPLVDQTALLKALTTGQIRGAALDVTDPEPLPPNDPLWKAPNLIITPHISWRVGGYYNRVLEVLEINLTRLEKGEEMVNKVNRKLNY